MKSFGFFFVFVAFVFFVGVLPAEAQYYGNGGNCHRQPLQGVLQGNLNMVRGLYQQLPGMGAYRCYGGYYGNFGNDGYFYGLYDQGGHRMSRPVKILIGAGVGASLGYGISGNGRGAAIGGAIGAIVGLIAGRDRGQQPQYSQSDYQQQQQYQTPESQQYQQPQPQYQQPQEQTPQQVTPAPVPEPSQLVEPQGEFRLVNRTSFSLDVYDGNTFLGRMKSGESWGADAPKVAFHADARIPNNKGGISVDAADIRATDTGWEFVPPSVAQGR